MNKLEILQAVKNNQISIGEAKRQLQKVRNDMLENNPIDMPGSKDSLSCFKRTLVPVISEVFAWEQQTYILSDSESILQQLATNNNAKIASLLIQKTVGIPLNKKEKDAPWTQLFNLIQETKESKPRILLALACDDMQIVKRHGIELVLLLQKMMQTEACQIVIGYYGRYHQIASETAAGLFKVVHIEKPTICGRVIFNQDSNQGALLSVMQQEIEIDSTLHQEIHYIDGERLSEISECAEYTPVKNGIKFRPNGIYLVTGGSIGVELSEFLLNKYQANIILCGRRASMEPTQLERLSRLGGNVVYIQTDITIAADVELLVQFIESEFGVLHGVFHSAGVLADSYVLKMSQQQLFDVMTPKFDGALVLDQATAHIQLDFFGLFSSLATIYPGPGQAAYLAANRAMSAFGRLRNNDVNQGERAGTTFIFHWPLWQNGGMKVAKADQDAFEKATGMRALPSDVAMDFIEQMMAASLAEAWIIYGKADDINRFVDYQNKLSLGDLPAGNLSATSGETKSDDITSGDHKEIEGFLIEVIYQVTQLEKNRIHLDQKFENFGFDSIIVNQFNRKLSSRFINVSKTVFFEYQTVRQLAKHLASLMQHHGERSSAPTTIAQQSEQPLVASEEKADIYEKAAKKDCEHQVHQPIEEIAIVGVAGQFPQAKNLEELLHNLQNSEDCISEIPCSRWPLIGFNGQDSDVGSRSMTAGGYLDDIEMFDPFFFNLSPRECEQIDPQERLFLQTVWHVLEQSGYSVEKLHRNNLTRDPIGSPRHNVGVYVGIASGQYAQLITRAHQGEEDFCTQSSSWSVANRISFFLDLHGPSISIDTACSSSLTAIHMACDALRLGKISTALVGGVSLNIDPLRNNNLHMTNMLSKDKRCHSFGEGGDGYVPGEGVIAIMLKPLTKAQQDNDNIEAVILASGLNHGGRTHGYTVPSPTAQASLIAETLNSAKIDPATISYFEAHGTGTALGDPIEISGAIRGFSTAASVATASVAIGSIKTNIGHLEPAAGLAGLSKIILQFRSKQLFPSLHAEQENPNIDFGTTPFYVQKYLQPWKPIANVRRAALSSFGAGGANGHLIVEDYHKAEARLIENHQPQLVMISAMSQKTLKQMTSNYIDFINLMLASSDSLDTPHFNEFATMLRSSRTHLDCRLVFVATDYKDALQKLHSFIEQGASDQVFCGRITDSEAHVEKLVSQQDLAGYLAQGDWLSIIKLWLVNGVLPWHQVEQTSTKFIRLIPTYAFERNPIWFNRGAALNKPKPAYPISISTEVNSDSAIFHFTLNKNSPIVSDHRVMGQLMLAGTAQLELVRKSALDFGLIDEEANFIFSDVYFAKPITLEDELTTITVELNRSGQGTRFSVKSDGIHSRGEITTRLTANQKIQPGTQLEEKLEGGVLYDLFASAGLKYGDFYQGIKSVSYNHNQSSANIELKKTVDPQLYFHPGIVDSCLQSASVISADDTTAIYLPYSVKEIRVYQAAKNIVQVNCQLITLVSNSESSFNIDMMSATGDCCIEYIDFKCKAAKLPQNKQQENVGLYIPRWQQIAGATDFIPSQSSACIIFTTNADFGLAQALQSHHGEKNTQIVEVSSQQTTDDFCQILASASEHQYLKIYYLAGLQQRLPQSLDAENCHSQIAQVIMPLFRLAKSLFKISINEMALDVIANNMCNVVTNDDPFNVIANGIVGLTKTLSKEKTAVTTRLIDLTEMCLNDCSQSNQWQNLLTNIDKAPGLMPDSTVALRNDEFYRETFQETHIKSTNVTDGFKQQGVYVIIGGAGGLGLVTAKYLLETYNARVILIGRRENPQFVLPMDKGQWHYMQANFNDSAQSQSVMKKIIATYGQINGIIHSAIVLKDRTIANMTEETFNKVLMPKSVGIVNLIQAVNNISLDFVVFYSSATSQSCLPGQANYAAACNIEDALARSLATKHKVQLINWGFWSEVGIVAKDKYRKAFAEQGVEGLSINDGLDILRKSIQSDEMQIITGSSKSSTQVQAATNEASLIEKFTAILQQLKGSFQLDDSKGTKPNNTDLQLKEITSKLIIKQFQQYQLFLQAGDSCSRQLLTGNIAVVPAYKRLFDAVIQVLLDNNLLVETQEILTTTPQLCIIDHQSLNQEITIFCQQYPEIKAMVVLLERCTDHLMAVISGKISYTEVMFPKGSDKLVAPLYRNNPTSDLSNQFVGEGVRALVESLNQRDKTLRILEIGAGTGGTTQTILPIINELKQKAQYDYTDISSHFLHRAKAEFASQYDFMRFFELDIDTDLTTQTIDIDSYDLVIATNVLHATKDIHLVLSNINSLLITNGLLILNEAVERKDVVTLTFGLSHGWWLYSDEDKRITHSPLLSPSQWQAALINAGFSDTEFVGDSPTAKKFGHSVVYSWAGQIKLIQGSNDTKDFLKSLIASIQKIPLEDIEDEISFDRYGVDSIVALELLDKIEKEYGKCPLEALTTENTVEKLTRYLDSKSEKIVSIIDTDNENIPMVKQVTSDAIVQIKDKGQDFAPTASSLTRPCAVAVVGMAGRYAQASNLDDFWTNLVSGKNCISKIPQQRLRGTKIPEAQQWGAYLDTVDQFDSLFFGIAPRDAERMDPQERMMLEVSWEALEDAGYTSERLNRYANSNNGVGAFVGTMYGHYELLAADEWAKGNPAPGFSPLYAVANNISRCMDFKGPSLTIDSACSSSLSCLHIAMQNIESGDCNAAIVGGVNLLLHPIHPASLSAMKMTAPDGICRIFSEQANGFVAGEGVGAILIKPLADAEQHGDHIYGIVKATALNSNGATANGVPSREAQSHLIRRTLQKAKLSPTDVQYVEVQSMGSLLGDKTEYQALLDVNAGLSHPMQPLLLGSLKPSIGHLEAAAGIAQLTKVMLQLRHGSLVATACQNGVTDDFDFRNSGLSLVTKNRAWDTHNNSLRRAGISSFGAGGSNVHVIVEEYQACYSEKKEFESYLLPISARKSERLTVYAHRLLNWLQSDNTGNLANIAYTFQVGRVSLRHKACFIVKDKFELMAALQCFIKEQFSENVIIGEARTDDSKSFACPSMTNFSADNHKRIGRAWVAGYRIQWEQLYTSPLTTLSLPTYPFDPVVHWFAKQGGELKQKTDMTIEPDQTSFDTTQKAAVAKTETVEKTITEKLESSMDESEQLSQRIELGRDNIKPTQREDQQREINSSLSPTEHMIKQQHIDDLVKLKLSLVLKMPVEEVCLDDPLSEFGFDSISLMELLSSFIDNYPIEIDVTVFFQHQTFGSFSIYLFENFRDAFIQESQLLTDSIEPAFNATPVINNDGAVETMPNVKQQQAPDSHRSMHDIAIIGMAGQFPGSKNLDEYWQQLIDGKLMYNELPRERKEKFGLYGGEYQPEHLQYLRGGFLDEIDMFDPLFFKISPHEARLIDPQQRLMLQTSWHAIEDAGYNPKDLAGSLTGVFIGVSPAQYLNVTYQNMDNEDKINFTATLQSLVPNRISFVLDINGPSEPIDTACSSSLVSVHRAVQSIRSGECIQAIAGGVNVILTTNAFLAFGLSGMLAGDGRCKSFDDRADGYIRGEGVGAVFLKTLNQAQIDGDNIRAVIKGTAVMHGGRSTSLTAPNSGAQAKLIESALTDANVSLSEIGYIEAHGTGTKIGDPIEINGLKQVVTNNPYQDQDIKRCAIGTVKANVGHLENAAGIAGLIKTVLCLQKKELPAIATLESENKMIHLENTPYYLLKERTPWPTPVNQHSVKLRRHAAISSFGVGGAIAHMVLAEPEKSSASVQHSNYPYVVRLSALSHQQLQEMAVNLLAEISDKPTMLLHNVALTLMHGRQDYNHRLAFVVSSMQGLAEELNHFINNAVSHYFCENTEDNVAVIELLQNESGVAVVSHHMASRDIGKIASLWVKGLEVDWSVLWPTNSYTKVSLPGYPFAKESYWVLPKESATATVSQVPEPQVGVKSVPTTQVEVKAVPIRQVAVPQVEARSQVVTPAPVTQVTISKVAAIETQATSEFNALDKEADTQHLRDVLENIIQIFSDVLYIPKEKLKIEAPVSDFGVDSLSGLRIIQRLQECYGDELPAAAILSENTIAKLSKFIANTVSPNQLDLNSEKERTHEQQQEQHSDELIIEKTSIEETVLAQTVTVHKEKESVQVEKKTIASSLLSHPTSSDLRMVLQSIPLIPGCDDVPLFVVCGTTGELSWSFHWLRHLAEDSAVYGLELLPTDLVDFTVDEFIGNCFQCVSATQRRSSIRIAAYGANVKLAVKLANRLTELGITVEQLLTFEPRFSSAESSHSAIEQVVTQCTAVWLDEEQRMSFPKELIEKNNSTSIVAVYNWLLKQDNIPVANDKLFSWLATGVNYVNYFSALLENIDCQPLDAMVSLTVYSSRTDDLQTTDSWPTDTQFFDLNSADHPAAILCSNAPDKTAKVSDKIVIATTSPLKVPLVTLKKTGKYPAQYCCPTLYGDSGYAVSLSFNMGGDYPIFAFEQLDADTNAFLYPNLKSMASAYIQRLISHQSEGPYILTGISFGGILAFEMCYQLQCLGKEVSHLILLDPYMPNTEGMSVFDNIPTEIDGVELHILELSTNLFNRWKVKNSLDYGLLAGRTEDEQREIMSQHLIKESIRDLTIKQARHIILSHFSIDKSNNKSIKGYYPKKLTKPVNTMMFSAIQGFYNPANHETNQHYSLDEIPVLDDLTKGFKDYLTGEFELVEFDTDHISMISYLPDCAQNIARFISQDKQESVVLTTTETESPTRVTYEI